MSIHEVSNDGQEMPASGTAPGPAVGEDVPMQAEDIQPRPAPVPQPSQPTKTFFGLAQDAGRQGFSRPAFNGDYVARFPEDPYGQETAPNARAWRVYVEEAAAFDENMVGQSRDGLDVMLVFAGLFSAVVTSFLVQVSQNLQADFSEMSALLLHDLLVVQLAMVDGATVNVTTPSINPAEKFEPDVIDIWINGLWVVSLTTSLVVALASVLVKQWLHRYMTFRSGTPELRSHIRQFRFMGLEKWRVLIIIGMLPIIMHISLLLFFTGLTLFYIPLRVSLAWAVGTLTALVCVLYLVSNTLPIVFPHCPYQTPLTDFIHHVYRAVRLGIHPIRRLWRKTVCHCSVAWCDIRKLDISSDHPSFTASEVSQSQSKSLAQLESDAVQDAHHTLSVDALDWLYHMSSNPTVHSLVLQGISGLHAKSRSYAMTKWSGATNMQSQRRELLQEAFRWVDLPDQPWERLCRSYVFLPTENNFQLNAEVALRLESIGCGRDRDPHVRAASLFVYSQSWNSFNSEAVPFFASHSDVLMPPLIWEEIVRLALKRHDIDECTLAHDIDECSLAQFLYAVLSVETVLSPTASLMTGIQVVWRKFEPEIFDTLLEWPLLARYDSVSVESISSYCRILIAAGKLALSHVQHQDDMDYFAICHYLKLLARVVRRSTTAAQWTVDFDFVCSVITVIQDGSVTSLPSEPENNPCLSCLPDIQRFYERSSSRPEFHFPRLEFLLQTWAGFYDSTQYDADFEDVQRSNLHMPMDIMGNALSRGHEEAYRIFRNERWMRIIFTEWAICGGGVSEDLMDRDACVNPCLNRVIMGYIEGLYTLTLDSNHREFCEYLHQPQQLILIFMLLVGTDTKYSVGHFVERVAKICPTHTSWRDCDTALKVILAWARTPNAEIPLFPWPPSLQSLSATAAFHKYPLVDWTARRFSDQQMRECLEVGLETLHAVLENAESVEGVLIPDLENQISINAASAPESHVFASDED